MALGSLSEYLKDKFVAKLHADKKTKARRGKTQKWAVQFFNHRTENAGKEHKEQPLNSAYTVHDLIKGPLGSTDHLKLKKTKHKNVKVSPDCEKNLELMVNLHFEDEVAFKAFKDVLYNKDFIGLETKKYFLRSFIENETTKALKLFDHELMPRGYSQKDFSNSFKRSVDKHEISNMMKQQLLGSNEEASCSQLFQLNDTNCLHSNQFLAESNLFLLGDSKKNSMGFFRGQDSQLMSLLHGKDTPGDPSNLLGEINKNFNSLHRRNKDNSNHLELTPVKGELAEKRIMNKGFRDMKLPGELGDADDRPISNFIFQNDNASKGFELTQKDMVNKSQHLQKRGGYFDSKNARKGNRETPVYDFKNVTKKIYEVENLNKLKKEKTKKSGKIINENLELFLQETERMSRKENKKESKKIEENVSFNEKDNSNIGNYSNSVNTRKSTKKYEEGLLNLYSKV